MPQYSAQDFREILHDRVRFQEIAEYFISKAVEDARLAHSDEEFAKYLEAGLQILVAQASAAVFTACESPIEKVFVNSLFLGFVKANPLGIVITGPLHDAPRDIENFRQYHSKFCEFIQWYQDRHHSLEGVEKFLDSEVANGKMEQNERRDIGRHLALYKYLGLYDRLHLSLQPQFHDLKVDGRSIRADMLVWVPGDPSVRIVVECDGFQFHSDKATFERDRKRDRLFKSHGYEVLRFSGAEINKDPIGISTEFREILENRSQTKNGSKDG